jgi:hypothetical protein
LHHATGSVAAPGGEWLRVYTDTAFTVALDTSRVERIANNAFLVWFETRWARPHQTQAPGPFNRETIRTILRCRPVAYKTVHVSVSLDAGPVVAEQGGTVADAERQEWKVPAPDSADEHSFVAACAALSPADGRPRLPERSL